MADIPSITPVPPATTVGTNTPQLSNAPVQQAPATLTPPAQIVGTIISSNPQVQQLTIQTAQGQIVVQSSAALPPNTPVTVDLHATNAQMRATVTVTQQNIAQPLPQTPAAPLATPPPLLQEGSTVTALQLQAPSSSAIALPVPLEQIAASLEALKKTGFKNIQLPLPQQQLEELLTTPNIQKFLSQLPPQLLRNLADYLFNPSQQARQEKPQNIFSRLFQAYLPQKPVPDNTAPSPAPPHTADDNSLQALRPPLQARPSQASESPPVPGNTKPAGSPFLTMPIATLLASSSETSQETSAFSAILRQLISHGEATPQNMFRLHILKIIPPEATPEQVKTLMAKMPATAQTAAVESTTSGGQPIFKATDAHYALQTPATVPSGSRVVFEATPMMPEEILQPGFFTPKDSQNNTWPALQEALKNLPPASPAAQALKDTIPSPTPQLAPAALFFLAALRSGAIGNWLGPAPLQTLQQAGKKDLADTLSSDFDRLSTQSKDTLPGDWRSISIPLRHENQVSQMQFYVRQQGDREQEEKGQGGGRPATRFILNLSLSRMGALQLDGFIQKKSFDIILRTEDKLPFEMRQELMQKFALGLEQVNMQGGISFQTRQQGWMVPEARNTTAEV